MGVWGALIMGKRLAISLTVVAIVSSAHGPALARTLAVGDVSPDQANEVTSLDVLSSMPMPEAFAAIERGHPGFAGAYIDGEETVARFTHEPIADEDELRKALATVSPSFGDTRRIRYELADYSASELLEFERRVMPTEVDRLVYWGTDWKANSVVVSVDRAVGLERLSEELSDQLRIPEGALTVTETPGGIVQTLDQYHRPLVGRMSRSSLNLGE
jgi:hypothetical protein